MVTVRDPQTALPSAYLHEMMRFPSSDTPFTEWLDDAIANPRRINRSAESLEQYRYASMLPQFQTAFDGKITILKYEDLVTSPSDFSRALGRLIGADTETIEHLLSLPPLNATRSTAWYGYRRLVNVLSKTPFLDVRSSSISRKLNAAVERWTAKLPKETLLLSDYDRTRIAQYFPYELRVDRRGDGTPDNER